MAEESDEPREVPWHPRFAPSVLGHAEAVADFEAAFASGRPHHAWLISGPMGIGKATLAYHLATKVFSQNGNSTQAQRWVHARAHPDLALLERSLTDTKPKRLKAEISVENARGFIEFFSRTSSGTGWRVGLVDAADDLNTESANALLKLVEEPPSKCLILLVCHTPGRLLRTLRSRCRRLALKPMPESDLRNVLANLQLEKPLTPENIHAVSAIANGSPGRALQLLNSEGAKAFQKFVGAKRLDAPMRAAVGQHFSTRAAAQQDFEIFMDLLLDWTARRASGEQRTALAKVHASLSGQRSIVEGYNLDRSVAVSDALVQLDHALKEA
jgi:DNA polymerase III subunit delta'